MSIDLSLHSKRIRKIQHKSNSLNYSNFKLNRLAYRKYSDKKKEQFYKEFAILINSGVDFEQSLEILIKQHANIKDKELLIYLKNNVVKGKSLFEVMKNSKMFSPYEYYSVKIGEETRELERVFIELQSYFGRKIKMKRQLIAVFTYPFFVILITGMVLFFMLNNVVPMFTSVFKQFGGELPSLTQKIIILSNNLPYIMMTFLVIVVIFILIHIFLKNNENYRRTVSFLLLKLPVFGKLTQKIYLARFSQSLSLLLGSKTPLVKSLELTQKMIKFYPIEKSIQEIRDDILKGITFGIALEKHSIYNDKLVSMIKVGEEVNKLDKMFDRIVIQYNDEIEHQTKMVGVILEPVIIISIGLIVGVIMIAMYSPMFDLSKILGQ